METNPTKTSFATASPDGKPDPGYGYRILKIGEKLRPGVELCLTNAVELGLADHVRWSPVPKVYLDAYNDKGYSFGDNWPDDGNVAFFRTSLNEDPSYEIVPIEAQLLPGDQYLFGSGIWVDSAIPSPQSRIAGNILVYRRLKAAAKASAAPEFNPDGSPNPGPGYRLLGPDEVLQAGGAAWIVGRSKVWSEDSGLAAVFGALGATASSFGTLQAYFRRKLVGDAASPLLEPAFMGVTTLQLSEDASKPVSRGAALNNAFSETVKWYKDQLKEAQEACEAAADVFRDIGITQKRPNGSPRSLAEMSIDVKALWKARGVESLLEPVLNTPDIGEGYRKLASDELVETGDEVFSPVAKIWEQSGNTYGNHKQSPFLVYRRKIEDAPAPAPDIGEGYRKLVTGDVIQVGDEYFSSTLNRWQASGRYLGDCKQAPQVIYRRKIESPAPPPTEDKADPTPTQFRRLDCGEPVLKTDVYNNQGDPTKIWFTLADIGGETRDSSSFRKMTPGETNSSYRDLHPNETVRRDDEIFSPQTGDWVKAYDEGQPQIKGNSYRRKIVPVDKEQTARILEFLKPHEAVLK